jgi:DNA repair protein RecO (recombination protein O)
MTLHYRTKGIVLKKRDNSESDRFYSVYTCDFGHVEVLGKAIRKINSKLRSGIDVFSLAEIEFIQGKKNKTLTDAIKIKKFDNINKDLKNLETAHQISALMNNFIKEKEKDEGVFNLLQETFERINSLPQIPQLVYHYFFWNFFASLGYCPQVQKCAVCQGKLNPYGIYFSNKEGGIVCKQCSFTDRNSQKIHSDVVKILRLILNRDWQTVSRLRVDARSKESLNFISNNYHLYQKNNIC